ncbi:MULTISPECIES: thiol:disulfide interchange protein DsbA/DsbL [Thioalkalivibrio]|uniref:thiol:disulfide interchange protein DsbA/DsbL n=1 Tax=Thioalkalivibrio TaxID=106633 RepID=UPI000371296A|nr:MULTISPECIES: thiol:disulfide interchange protein DsbA/DsbL [Thioalkalivibrio]OOC50273.1 disulfide bond formation protein DsbA [Thioalkalivibrio versutus]
MKRREFMGALGGAGLLLATGTSLAAEYREGQHYRAIQPPLDTGLEDGKIQVVEIFWYGCPHCYEFEPKVQAWKPGLADDVQFEYLPAPMNDVWALHARVYYTAEKLGVLDEVHQAFYDAIHDQGRQLRSESAILRFINQRGLDADEFRETMRSDAIRQRIVEATEAVQDYAVSGVPTLVINGEASVSASMAGGHDEMLEVADYLIERARG